MRLSYIIFILIWSFTLLFSCRHSSPPKPRGYFRIELPPKTYSIVDTILPYSFELPQYARLDIQKINPEEPPRVNLNFPRFDARLYLSYKTVNSNNLYQLLEDNRKLAFKHSIKAEAINERLYSNPDEKVYGELFEIKGNAASPLQFFVTDSTRHFLRGSLYFGSIPNKDSLAPVIDYLSEDVIRLMETLTWKNQ